MSKINKSKYVEGIASSDDHILQLIYEESLPEVAKYVKKNSGNFDDAKDVFQEGILVVFRKVQDGKLELTTSFHNYLFSVCRKIWLKKLRKQSIREIPLSGEEKFSYEEHFEERMIRTRKWNLFNEKLNLLSEDCQKVLKLSFNGWSGKEIAKEMGYTEAYVKRKKYKCKLMLVNLIKSSSEYRNLKN